MNEAWLWLIIPAGYILGMTVTSFVLGWVVRNLDKDDLLREMLVPMGVSVWPIGLPVGLFFVLTGPILWTIFNLIVGAFNLGAGLGDPRFGARTKKVFGRIGR